MKCNEWTTNWWCNYSSRGTFIFFSRATSSKSSNSCSDSERSLANSPWRQPAFSWISTLLSPDVKINRTSLPTWSNQEQRAKHSHFTMPIRTSPCISHVVIRPILLGDKHIMMTHSSKSTYVPCKPTTRVKFGSAEACQGTQEPATCFSRSKRQSKSVKWTATWLKSPSFLANWIGMSITVTMLHPLILELIGYTYCIIGSPVLFPSLELPHNRSSLHTENGRSIDWPLMRGNHERSWYVDLV